MNQKALEAMPEIVNEIIRLGVRYIFFKGFYKGTLGVFLCIFLVLCFRVLIYFLEWGGAFYIDCFGWYNRSETFLSYFLVAHLMKLSCIVDMVNGFKLFL